LGSPGRRCSHHHDLVELLDAGSEGRRCRRIVGRAGCELLARRDHSGAVRGQNHLEPGSAEDALEDALDRFAGRDERDMDTGGDDLPTIREGNPVSRPQPGERLFERDSGKAD